MWGPIQGSLLVVLKPVPINEILLRKLAIKKGLHIQNEKNYLSVSYRIIVLVCMGLKVRAGDKRFVKGMPKEREMDSVTFQRE